MKKIKLTQGKFALVDNKDIHSLSKFKWFAVPCHGECYAARCAIFNGKKRNIYMHRQILQTINSKFVTDHIDGNGLNNQRNNIRICTQAENLRNQNKKSGNNPFKGVYFLQNKWVSYIQVNRERIFVGSFKNKIDAAKSYNKFALKYHGKFARLNEIKVKSS